MENFIYRYKFNGVTIKVFYYCRKDDINEIL